ncbi:MAG: hypothetical protein ACR2M7_05020 [Bdellovibrionales bacterium]
MKTLAILLLIIFHSFAQADHCPERSGVLHIDNDYCHIQEEDTQDDWESRYFSTHSKDSIFLSEEGLFVEDDSSSPSENHSSIMDFIKNLYSSSEEESDKNQEDKQHSSPEEPLDKNQEEERQKYEKSKPVFMLNFKDSRHSNKIRYYEVAQMSTSINRITSVGYIKLNFKLLFKSEEDYKNNKDYRNSDMTCFKTDWKYEDLEMSLTPLENHNRNAENLSFIFKKINLKGPKPYPIPIPLPFRVNHKNSNMYIMDIVERDQQTKAEISRQYSRVQFFDVNNQVSSMDIINGGFEYFSSCSDYLK